ncbi:hypothetical protein [Streptomyces sp. PR69]|uniref:hypothetical protein n=1 Tax=Streptomyces sp. PR69 TaxID=2984950 RepID=UPI0022650132|nr:hypothetical protein [Streptomyces sp. PR69]
MGRVRRGLVHALAWSLSTGAATALSWWGVHTVMAGTAYDPPRAVALPAGDSAASDGTDGTNGSAAVGNTPAPAASSTSRPPKSPGPSAPSPNPSGPATSPAPAKPEKATPPSATSPASSSAPSGSSGNVKGYTVDGGRVVFDLGETSAELVSATPAAGWQMQVWKQPTWIRVTFTEDGREVSVFCTWHDTAPRVQIDER